MRIAYLHQYFNTPEMSGGTRSYEMARRLVAAGHQVHMITSSREAGARGDWYRSDVEGIDVHWLPVPYANRMGTARRLRAFAAFALRAGDRAASVGADVVLATSTPLTIALPGVRAARRLGVPMVFEVRDLWPDLPIAVGALRNPLAIAAARRLERWAYGNAAAIVALSPGMAARVIEQGVPAERVTVIPNSADLARFAPDARARQAFRARHGIGDDEVVVTYAGTFGAINGVDWLVRVAARLGDAPGLRFLFVGDGACEAAARALALELGVPQRCFLGRLPKTDMAAVLAATDVAASCFLPLEAMEANSANKVFDALAAGCCVAVNYGGWQAELLEESGAGVRLPRDVDAAAEALRVLAADRERLAASGRAARGLAEARFARDDHARQFEAVLVDAAAPGRRG